MDILPSFERVELGLKMALLSDRFDALVDKHFDDKTTELTIWRRIGICDGIGPAPRLIERRVDGTFVHFQLPDHPLPNKIRFKDLWIMYIDDSVLAFIHSNKQIWDRNGTKLLIQIRLDEDVFKPIWDVFTSEIWPVFETNVRHLLFNNADYLDNFRRRISPTILTDLDQLNSIQSDDLFPDQIADDEPNATARQVLSKWVHTPSKNGQPKRLFCRDVDFEEENFDWINSFKETFLGATASVSYKIRIALHSETSPIEPFESENERTQEKLTLLLVEEALEEDGYEFTKKWLLKRCPISEKAAPVQWENDENWDDNLNTVQFSLWGGKSSIGPYGFLRTKKKKLVKASKYRRIARKTNYLY